MTRQLQKDLARSEIWQLTNIWLEVAREYMSPPDRLKTQRERAGSFASQSSGLDSSVTQVVAGSPVSRSQKMSPALGGGRSLHDYKEKSRGQTPGSPPEAEEVANDKNTSVDSGERSKQGPGSEA